MTYDKLIQDSVDELNRRECLDIAVEDFDGMWIESELYDLYMMYLGEEQAQELSNAFARAMLEDMGMEICESSKQKMSGISLRGLGSRLVATLSASLARA